MSKTSPIAQAVQTVLAASIGLTGLASGNVYAADAAADESPASLGLEEVVVTSRRIEERLQDVPIAVTSFSPQEMVNLNVTQTSDVARYTPSMYTQANAASNLSSVMTAIRGQVQADTLGTLDTSVGWYIDDVYLPRSVGVAGSLYDLQRVEVLKGPQGTLYGRNTTGGAIKLVTTKADPSGDYSGMFNTGMGSFGSWKVGGAINLPLITDKLALRLTGMYDQVDDGYGGVTVTRMPTVANFYPDNGNINIQTHREEAGQRDSRMFRVGLTYNVLDNLSLEALYEYTYFYANAPLVNIRPLTLPLPPVLNNLFGFKPYTPPKDLLTGGQVNALQRANADADTVSVTLHWDINDTLSTKLIYGYRDLNSTFMSDVDGTPLPVNYFPEPFIQDSTMNSLEWQLAGQAFSDRLQWLLGVYLFEEKVKDFSTSNSFAQVLRPPLGAPPRIYAGTFWGTVDKNESQSGFLSVTYDLTDAIELNGGVRFTHDKKPVEVQAEEWLTPDGSSVICRFDPLTNPNPDLENCTWSNSDDFDYWSWSGSVNWKVTDEIMPYLRSSRTFRAGGQNMRGLGLAPIPGTGEIVNTSEPFDPESATDVELGIKSRFFDRRVLLNLAYYYMWYDNFQQSLLLGTPKGLTTFVANQSNANFQGVEIETQWLVTESFRLSANGSWFDYKYDEKRDYANSMPEWQAAASADYKLSTPVGDMNFNLNYTYRGDFLPNTSLTRQQLESNNIVVKAVSLWNARIGLDLGEGLNVGLWGRNLADEDYTLAPLVINLGTAYDLAANPGEPRSFGVDMNFNF